MLPKLLEENTFFWRPMILAEERRRREQEYWEEISKFFTEHGFVLVSGAPGSASVFVRESDMVRIEFLYQESSNHVYKYCRIWINGRRSNLRKLKRIL